MRDWHAFVRERLRLPDLAPGREARIVREVAAQLEDLYRDAIAGGAGEGEADARAAAHIANWPRLAADLRRADRAHVEPRVDRLVAAIEQHPAERRSLLMFAHLLRDSRYAIRQLVKAPAFTMVAVATLALGIGANTAIFSVIDAVLLSNLPVKDPQQLVFLTNPDEQGLEIGFGDGDRDFVTYPEFRQLERNHEVLSGLLAASNFTARLPVQLRTGDAEANGAPARISLISGSYFSVLGVTPILGRAFGPEVDTVRDANPVAVISDAFWRERFGGAGDVIGRSLRILKTSYEVVGVAPPQFHGETVGDNPDVWVPLTMQAEILPGQDYLAQETKPFRKTEWLQVIGRLKPGVTVAEARASVEVEFHQMMQAQAGGMSAREQRQFLNQHLAVTPGSHGASTLRGDFGKPLEILMVVVGLILLIACANIANILLARSAARRKEMSIRVALGAGAPRLFRQVLTESLLLAAIGGAVGLLLAHWADAALLRMVSTTSNRVRLDVHADAGVLAFTCGVSLLTGVLFGLVPALQATRADLIGVLKGTSRGIAGTTVRSGGLPAGKVLVVAQVALSLVLLVVAALFVRSFRNVSSTQLGYDRDHLLEFYLNPVSYGYRPTELAALDQNVLLRIGAIRGVRGATLTDNPLMSGRDSNSPVTVEGEKPLAGDAADARWDLVGPDFFSTTGIPILQGREITGRDSGTRERVGVINETMARKFFPQGSPLGRHVFVHTASGDVPFVVVGVVRDSKQHSAKEKPSPRFYVPYFNPIGSDWTSGAAIVVRTTGDPASLSSVIRSVVKQAAPNLPPVTIETIDQRFADSVVIDRLIANLSGAFGLVAVILVCIGLYGVMAYATSRRTNEIGIRLALGADRGGVLWLILRESLLLVLIGAAIGVPLVFVAGTWISSLLFGLHPADPAALAFAIGLMFVVGVLASYIPARRAARVDPLAALRSET
ncbi:MAG TPA: ABC transporter permease [Vicinamibacterales bacterium]|nr:ABC transporter permease [Vicinamibacterales bacterium]